MPPDDGPVIVNATPIITLSLIGHLDLFRDLYGGILVPEAVHDEVTASGDLRPGAAELRTSGWIEVVELADSQRAAVLSDLDRGEAEVIALALERNARLVILDERLARRHAQNLSLPLTGSLGVLLEGKRQGRLEELAPLLGALQAAGIRMKQDLVERVLVLAGETPHP